MEQSTKIALVTGATGAVGPVLVHKLVSAGYAVRVLARRPVVSGLLPESVPVVTGEITDQSAVERAVEGANYVFHLAAKLHISNPGPELRDEYRRVNVDGTQVILNASQAAGVERLVFFSTIAVYGPSADGGLLTESSAASANTLYAATKREAEQLVLTTTNLHGEPLGVVLRLAAVYGSRVKGNYRALVRWLHRGMFIPIGSGGNRRTLVHEKDAVAAALLAAEHSAAAGQIFNVTDGSIHTFNEIMQAIAQAIGRKPPRVYVAHSIARIGASVGDAVLQLGGRPALLRPLVEKMTEEVAVSGERMQEILGFRPQFDLSRGWREAIPVRVDR